VLLYNGKTKQNASKIAVGNRSRRERAWMTLLAMPRNLHSRGRQPGLG
jgi:hypothetical protein